MLWFEGVAKLHGYAWRDRKGGLKLTAQNHLGLEKENSQCTILGCGVGQMDN